jgi:uncharacterized membrane protein YesL
MEVDLMGYYKGQFSLTNIIGVFLGLIVYLLVAIPIILPLTDATVVTLEADPNAYTPLIVALLYLIPFFMLMGIIVTIFRYAVGEHPGQQYVR